MSSWSSICSENEFTPNEFIRSITMPNAIFPPEILELILRYTIDHFGPVQLHDYLEATSSMDLPLMRSVGSVCKFWRRVVISHYYRQIKNYLAWYEATEQQVEILLCDHVFYKGSFQYYLQEGMISIWEVGQHFDRARQLSLLAGFFHALCWNDYEHREHLMFRNGVTKEQLLQCQMFMHQLPCKSRKITLFPVRTSGQMQFDDWFDADIDVENGIVNPHLENPHLVNPHLVNPHLVMQRRLTYNAMNIDQPEQ